jgi:hypothetical protein
MKIIGKTEKGFLVEASQYELLNCAGVNSMDAFVKQNGAFYVDQKGNRWDWSFQIGASFSVSNTFAWVQSLREQEKQILASADILGNLSEMLRGGIPSAIIPQTAESTNENK